MYVKKVAQRKEKKCEESNHTEGRETTCEGSSCTDGQYVKRANERLETACEESSPTEGLETAL